ncbi:unannotated protein [freshwater metagenome]|uniref:Unannotated protein n=1 Tax=freshwater metagenome TaxID=449393 RepID=A0A6J6HQT3_9ZZZZ|nr:hypothetical protein [Actinomycetota bacterium]
MSRQPFSDFLATKDEAIHAQLIAIDKAIVKAVPGIDAAIKWKQYMYSFDSKWMAPLCMIDTTKKGIALRFLAGSEMADPLGVLRFGASDMGTWDIPLDSKVKASDITSYVKAALASSKSNS